MNRQEILNTVFTKLMAQGEKCNRKSAANPDGSYEHFGCYYHGFTATGKPARCGIGHVIPDELYYPRMEGSYINTIIDNTPLLVDYLEIGKSPKPDYFKIQRDSDVSFLATLQNIHDQTIPALWLAEFHKFAHNYGLTLPILPPVEPAEPIAEAR